MREIFNLFGAGFSILSFAVAYFVAEPMGYEGVYGTLFVAGVFCIIVDLAARLPAVNFWDSSVGGVLLYLPLWLLGLLLAGYAYDVMYGLI